MRFHIEEPKLEYCEQPDGARADDENVSFDRFGHVQSVLVADRVLC
jgi:hypothetical protein